MTYACSPARRFVLVESTDVPSHIYDERDAGYVVYSTLIKSPSGRCHMAEDWVPIAIGATCDVIPPLIHP